MASVRYGIFCLAVLITGICGTFSAHADTISTWNGGTGNWSTASQWTPAQVPNNSQGRAYAVTAGSNGLVTLDVSPTINSLLLNGGLTTGYDVSTGNYTALTVTHNVTVNGGIGGGASPGLLDMLDIGRNLTNNGYIRTVSDLTVGGSVLNTGTLLPFGGQGSCFCVTGTVVNAGTLQFGNIGGEYTGSSGDLGGIVNTGSIFVGPGSAVSVGTSVTDIPKGASWEIGGLLTGAFAGLRSIEGLLDVEGTTNGLNDVVPLVIGSTGNTVHNTSSFTVGSSYGDSVVNVIGNFSNSGIVQVAYPGSTAPRLPLGSSTLNVSGTLTNQANGTINVSPTDAGAPYPLVSSALNAQTLVNYGDTELQAVTVSTVQRLINSGTLNIYGDSAGDIGQLTVGTLETAGGLVKVWNSGGTLIVGSGAVVSGFSGYDQLANGVLETAGGGLNILGNAFLNGTLDIMLGTGYKPVGTVFDVLSIDLPGVLTGTFSDVNGLVFDGGKERYLLSYDYPQGLVTLTVETNATPEPGSIFFLAGGLFGIAGAGFLKKRIGTRKRLNAS